MSRRKKHPAHENHERWLVSYADFITLLFAFFVVLYASSQVDKKKMGQLAFAIQTAFQEMGVFQGKNIGPPTEDGGGGPAQPRSASEELARMTPPKVQGPPMSRPEIGTLKRELEEALAPEIAKHEVVLHIGPDGLVVSLREMGFFDSGSAVMRKDSEGSFNRVADLIKQYPFNVRVEGHTDNVPIHTSQFKSNWELSTARATEVIRKLILDHGFAPERLSASGYGEFHPVGTNATTEGRQANRRVDLVILAVAGGRIAPLEKLKEASDKVRAETGR